MKQIYSAHASVQSTFTLPDLAGALKQIQNQYDDIAAKNLQVKKNHSALLLIVLVIQQNAGVIN